MIIKAIKNPMHMARRLISLILLVIAVVSCSETFDSDVGDQTAQSAMNDGDIIIQIGDDVTRGNYVAGPSLLKYGVYSYYSDNKKTYLSNSIVSRTAVGDPWKKSKNIKFPNATRELDFYALAPGFTYSGVTTTMTSDLKGVSFKLPTINAMQTDFMFSSLMAQTRNSTNNIIKFNFKHLFSYLRFNAKLSNADIDVTIHSVRLHNLKSTGTFTMSNTKANAGDWVLDNNEYDTYEFVLPKDSTLTYKKTITIHKTDSMLFVMSQKPVLFNFTEGSSFAEADAAKQAYVSVLCRIVNKNDNSYVGCTDTTWAEVYYPLKSATWTTTKQPYGGTYTVSIDFTGGYTKDGNDFLKEYSGDGSLENTSVEGVQGGVTTTADWEDDTDNSVTITL